MKKLLSLLFLLFILNSVEAQSNWKKFWRQSTPIKTWVLLHPFKAKKAFNISLKAQKVADSIALTNLLDKDKAGGQVDAFRHAFWMATLRQKIGKHAAKSLGKAHERENYRTFKKNKLENGEIPDKASKQMDLFNNNIGLSLVKKGSKTPKRVLILKIVNTIKRGELKIIKKDSKGKYLSCNGSEIPFKSLLHTWNNKKCLIPSNLK